MYCVIQEVELKKENTYGEYKELEAYYTSAGGRFKRPIKKAYKVSIHKSYRENGKVKKKQWVICTMDYYDIAKNTYCILDYTIQSKLEEKLIDMGITEEELLDLVNKKLDPLIAKVQKEYQQTEEYKTHKKHKDIINKYIKAKNEFESIYGKDIYDKCYDVFGTLRDKELLENIKNQYEASKEYERSYYENSNSSNNDYNSYGSYHNNKSSTYNDEEKERYKKIYKTLAKAYQPDIAKDDREMMKIVNKLKEEWGI